MFFETLKNATSGLHQEIETVNPIMKAGFTLAFYCLYLRMLGSYYSDVEKDMMEFAGSNGSPVEIKSRLKSPLIQMDLGALPCADSSPFESKIYRHRIGSLGDLIGTLYVLEGSTLGGQIIYRSLRSRLPLTEDQLHFFRGYGDRTGEMWRSLRDSVDALEFDHEDAVRSARNVFADQLEMIKILNRNR